MNISSMVHGMAQTPFQQRAELVKSEVECCNNSVLHLSLDKIKPSMNFSIFHKFRCYGVDNFLSKAEVKPREFHSCL